MYPPLTHCIRIYSILIHYINYILIAAGVYLSEAQNNVPPPLTHCIRIYSVLIHTGKIGGVEPYRRLEGEHFTMQVRKYQHD
jgi:hypothetical protein